MTTTEALTAPGATTANRRTLPRAAGFWFIGVLLSVYLGASTAPSPIYSIYQQRWHFSPTVLTAVFAIYAVAILIALLLFGSLSDHIGRRPVLLGSLVVEIVSMVVLGFAPSVGWLYAGRVLQGLATGAATSAISGALLDLQPPGKHLGPIVNSVSATTGVGFGALLAGTLVEFAPAPTVLVYLVLLAAFFVAVVLVFLLPEVRETAGTPLSQALRPQVPSVPAGHRVTFALLATSMLASWTVGGMFMSLGPSVAKGLVTGHPYFNGGLTIAVLGGTASIVQMVCSQWAGRRAVRVGTPLLVAGLAGLTWAIEAHSVIVLFGGTLVLGVGWGLTFMGGFRMMTALAPPAHRAGTSAMIYVVAYMSAAIPAVTLGFLATNLGLTVTTLIFTAAAALFAAVAGLSTFAHRQ